MISFLLESTSRESYVRSQVNIDQGQSIIDNNPRYTGRDHLNPFVISLITLLRSRYIKVAWNTIGRTYFKGARPASFLHFYTKLNSDLPMGLQPLCNHPIEGTYNILHLYIFRQLFIYLCHLSTHPECLSNKLQICCPTYGFKGTSWLTYMYIRGPFNHPQSWSLCHIAGKNEMPNFKHVPLICNFWLQFLILITKGTKPRGQYNFTIQVQVPNDSGKPLDQQVLQLPTTAVSKKNSVSESSFEIELAATPKVWLNINLSNEPAESDGNLKEHPFFGANKK